MELQLQRVRAPMRDHGPRGAVIIPAVMAKAGGMSADMSVIVISVFIEEDTDRLVTERDPGDRGDEDLEDLVEGLQMPDQGAASLGVCGRAQLEVLTPFAHHRRGGGEARGLERSTEEQGKTEGW